MSCPVCSNPSTTPACTGTDLLFEATTKTFTLHLCQICRCMFLHPMPGNDEIAGFYPAQYWWSTGKPGTLKKLESIYRRIVLHDHVSFIARAAAGHSGAALLDIGCGSGTLLGVLKERGFRVRGVDFSAEAANVAAVENGIDVFVGSLSDAAFAAGSFDFVTLFHVLEHVTKPIEVLAEVFRILKPHGSAILQVPNIDSWQFSLFGSKWYGLDIPRHVIDYSECGILRLLEDTGFHVQRIRHFNLRDNAPALVSSLFPSLDPVSRAVRQRKRNRAESGPAGWARHFVYLSLVIGAYPFAIAESAARRGATLMIEARKQEDSRFHSLN